MSRFFQFFVSAYRTSFSHRFLSVFRPYFFILPLFLFLFTMLFQSEISENFRNGSVFCTAVFAGNEENEGNEEIETNNAAASETAVKYDSFRPGEVWRDNNGTAINAHGGGILFHDGRYYWFGEHKIEGYAGNFAQVGVHCYSSEDLYNWKDEGIALKVSKNPKSDIAKGCILERPKVIFNAKTRKFVMWFHLEVGQNYSSARSGAAVADCVTGPYHFVESKRINAGFWPMNIEGQFREPLHPEEVEYLSKLRLGGGPVDGYPKDMIYRRDFFGGQMARDMTLFVDDDERAYHIYSSEDNGTLHIALLTDDYLHHSGTWVRALPGRFNEAPAVFKKDGKYYLFASGCTGWNPNAARLAVSDSMLGEWKEIGNPCRGPASETDVTFHSQSTYILPVVGRENTWIFLADRWNPQNAIDGRYVWLPIQFDVQGVPFLEWKDEWKY